jgi:ubiquinone biosynthesis monooxygenase Coq7
MRLQGLLEAAPRPRPVAPTSAAQEPARYPAEPYAETQLDGAARHHAAGLMRINHSGEIAAQALYHGQAAVARDAELRAHLLEAAEEERAHLDWCARRIDELGEKPSRLAPLWYAGSYAIGAVAGMAGDRWSLGFVAETEKQVAQHLDDHLERLSSEDGRSRAIVQNMREDEVRHGQNALERGGKALPLPVRGAMRATAQLMKLLAYRI